MSAVHMLHEQDLNRLQLTTLQYYLHEVNPENGLIDHMAQLNVGVSSRYGFKPSFNQTFEVPESPTGWWITHRRPWIRRSRACWLWCGGGSCGANNPL